MSADLLVIVPSRGRPESLPRVVQAWQDTGAFDDAELVFVIDADDPREPEYHLIPLPDKDGPVRLVTADRWRPMVPKLNLAATTWAGEYRALGFAGDDHLPRTKGWARAYLDALREMGTGIVYGNDLHRGAELPTQWAMTSDIVRTLGRMVPADVEHLYSDTSIRALGEAAGCIRYLPDVVIEHMHYAAGKAKVDDGYRAVNSPQRYREDRAAFMRWTNERCHLDAQAVRALRAAAV